MATKAKVKFTFKNYLIELKKSWLFLAIFFVIGGAAGAWYAFRKPTTYESSAKISVYNPTIEKGTTTSPYAQIADLIASKEFVADSVEAIKKDDISSYEVAEKPFGVFTITATAENSDKAINTANTIADNAEQIIDAAYEDGESYNVIVLEKAENASTATSTKSRLVSTIIAAFGALIVAAIVVFIKFDFCSE